MGMKTIPWKSVTCDVIDAFVDDRRESFADAIDRIIRVIFYFFMAGRTGGCGRGALLA